MLYLNLANIFSYRIQTPDKRFLKLVTDSIQLVNTYEEGTDFETLVSKNTWWINFKEKGTNLAIEHYENPSQTFLMTTKQYTGDWKQNYQINQVPNKPDMRTISVNLYGKDWCWELFKDQIIMKECQTKESAMFKLLTEKPATGSHLTK